MTKILFIDDDPSLLEIISLKIERLELKAAYARLRQPADIGSFITNEPIDIAFSDWEMGPLDVFKTLQEALKTHREKWPDSPDPKIYILSAWPEDVLNGKIAEKYALDSEEYHFLMALPKIPKDGWIEAIRNEFPNLEMEKSAPRQVLSVVRPIDNIKKARIALLDFIGEIITRNELDNELLSLSDEEFLRPSTKIRLLDKEKTEFITGFPRAGNGGPTIGRVVFSKEAIANYPGENVILVTDKAGPEMIALFATGDLPEDSGLIVISGDGASDHLPRQAENYGFGSNLMMTRQYAEQQGISLDMVAKEIHQGSKKIKEGDIVTIDTEYHRLVLGPTKIISGDTKMRDSIVAFMWKELCERLGDQLPSITWQVDRPRQCKEVLKIGEVCEIGLKRTKTGLASGKAVQCLIEGILAPSAEIREEHFAEVARIVKDDMLALFEHASPSTVHNIRVLDFRDDQFGRTEEEKKALRRVMHVDENQPVLGFGVAAKAFPSLYQLLTEATLEAAQERFGKNAHIRLIIPDAREAEDVRLATNLIEVARHNTGYEGKISFGIMAESEKGKNNLPAMIEAAVGYETSIFAGGNDRAAEYYNITRGADHELIEILEREGVNPLKALTDALKIDFLEMRDKAQGLPIVFCGDQATHPDSAAWLVRNGFGICLPTSANNIRNCVIVGLWQLMKKGMLLAPRGAIIRGTPNTVHRPAHG